MIRMTRLHLINWHNFCDDIIDFKNITYLLGVNAVGKTTIMDAIRYCLTTNKDFNIAGNKKSGRTLLGSVHQKQRAEDSYLRPGHTVSYIGIEFLDESINKTFVIIARIESETPRQSLKGVYQDWYITKSGYSLEDIPFFTKTKLGKRPTSKEQFKLSDRGMDRASNQADARRRICRVLGIGDADSPIGKKFNEVFHMGTSLEDIRDIREFIYTYILPEPKVDIEFLQRDTRELERLQEILQQAQDRAKLLEQINEKITEAQVRLEKVKVNELLVTYAKYQGNIEGQEENRKHIEQWKSNSAILDDKLNGLLIKEKAADKRLYQARKDKENNLENKKMLSLEEENKNNQVEYQICLKESDMFDKLKGELFALKTKLNQVGFCCEWDNDIIEKEDATINDRITQIKESNRVLSSHKEKIKDKEAQIRIDIATKEEECRALENKIKTLAKGIMCYPDEALLVRDTINNELSNQSITGEAKLLCELLYMKNDSWQDAVESYLNTQRFNIIVSPSNYKIAKKVFIELGDKVKGIGLIDTRKIQPIDNQKGEVKYLSDMVSSENVYAKRYVDFVMKDVVCCNSSDELENYRKSVTRDMLKFQNYCLQRMAKKEHFIGVDAIEKQLNKAKNELVKSQAELTKHKNDKKAFTKVVEQYEKFVIGNKFELLEKCCDSSNKAKTLYTKIKEIAVKIEDFKKNPIVLRLYDYVVECEKNMAEIRGEITDLEAQKKNLDRDIKRANVKIDELLKESNAKKQEYQKGIEQYPEYQTKVLDKYKEERKIKDAEAIANNFSNRVIQDNNALNEYLNNQLIPLQRQYTTTYGYDFPKGIEGASRYQKEYLRLCNVDIERHKKTFEQAQVRCKERFRKDVLFRMKDDISRAKAEIKKINKVMDNLEYGEESYHFSIEKSKDRELGSFYDIIMDKDNQQIEQDNSIMSYIAEMNKSDVFESQVEDFMQRIMVDIENYAKDNLKGSNSGAKDMSMYVDYRTYLDYDIIVKNSVTKLETPLSKVSGEGSGGENQAPFYVAICASLLQIYQQNENGCIKLVLLDEAFNNMTSDRIEPMMTMFKKLDLQLVLIATVEKATAIIPYCDITYSIVKSGNRNSIDAFERIDK